MSVLRSSPLTWAAVAASVILAVVSCAGPGRLFGKPRVSIAKIHIEKMGFSDQTSRVDVRVTNPNSVSMTITGIEGTIEVDGRPFARGVSTVTTEIPARGEAIVPVSLTASLSDVMALLKKFLKGGSEGLPYVITGNIHMAESFFLPDTIPFSSRGTFSPRGTKKGESSGQEGR
jgi:LEA14-like dessication related protein